MEEGHDEWYKHFLCASLCSSGDEPPLRGGGCDPECHDEVVPFLLRLMDGLEVTLGVACTTSDAKGGVVRCDLVEVNTKLAAEFGCTLQESAGSLELKLSAPIAAEFARFAKPDVMRKVVDRWAQHMVQYCAVLSAFESSSRTNESLSTGFAQWKADGAVLAFRDPRVDSKGAMDKLTREADDLLAEREGRTSGGASQSSPSHGFSWGGTSRPPRREVLRGNVFAAFPPQALQRLERVAGLETESTHQCALAEYPKLATAYLNKLVGKAIARAEHYRSRIVTCGHVTTATTTLGRTWGDKTVFGFGGPAEVRFMWSNSILSVYRQVADNCSLDHVAMSVLNDMVTHTIDRLTSSARTLRRSGHIPSYSPGAKKGDGHDSDGYDSDDDRATHRMAINAGPFSVGIDDVPGAGPKPKGQISMRAGAVFDASQRIYFYGTNGELRSDMTPADLARCPVEALSQPVDMITSRDIQSAVRDQFPGELSKFAVSEGTKALTKFASSYGSCHLQMGPSAGLQFNPEHVVLATTRLTSGYPMSPSASVYLAGVAEYIVAEVLELSIKVARKEGRYIISCRDIRAAVCEDAELVELFDGAVIRNGAGVGAVGRVTQIQPQAAPSVSQPSFEDLLLAKVRAAAAGAAVGVYVDPRDGCHYTYNLSPTTTTATASATTTSGGASQTSQNPPTPTPFTLLDSLCAESKEQRRAKAEAALTAVEAEAMRRESQDPLGEAPGAAAPGQCAAKLLVQREVQRAQQSVGPVLPIAGFSRYVAEVAQSYKSDVHFTKEAIEVIRALTEGHLVETIVSRTK